MNTAPFELGPIRPVDEAQSLLIRTTRGCPWNRCEFCVNYKDMKFSMRTLDEVKRDIAAAAEYYQGQTFETCFLQDGDSFLMKTAELVELLAFLKQKFPAPKRISSYGRAQTMVRKSDHEMQAICQAGLNKLYCGMESGSAKVLIEINPHFIRVLTIGVKPASGFFDRWRPGNTPCRPRRISLKNNAC